MKKFRLSKKIISFSNYKFSKFWLFFNKNIDMVEILEPTLDNLQLLKDMGFCYCVKGFKNHREFMVCDELRIKLCISLSMYATYSLGTKFIENAIISFINNDPLPSSKDIQNELDIKNLFDMSNPEEVDRLNNREKFFKRYKKNISRIRKLFFKFLMRSRIQKLDLIL